MKITLIAVGKIKEKFLREAIDEFKKRLTKYISLEIIEIPDEKTPEGANPDEILQREKEGILKHLPSQSYIITLAIEGKQLTSEEMASKIENLAVSGESHITFIIGGSLGLHKDLINKGSFLLSFSKFTFPHQLFRLILLEQIYRWFKIIKNEPYHK